jgi:hypothetical protein
MADYVPPWGPSTTDVPPLIKAPKPSKYVNTPYGPVLRTQLGRGPTFSPETAKQFAPGQIVGGYVDSVLLKCVPIIPNPIKKENEGGGGGSNGGGGDTKTVNTSNFTEIYFNSLPDYSIEEQLSLASLVGTELLRMSHRENFNTTSLVLNSNILELADTVYSFSPTELIKLQNPDLSYFQNNLSAYTISGASNDAVVTINIPNYKVEPSYKIEVENIAPKYIKNDTIYT